MSQLLKSPNPYANSPRRLGERPLSQYSDVDITEYLDESTNEYDFLPSSPLTALFTAPSTPPPFRPPPIPKIEENGVEKVLFDHRISAKSVTFSMPKSPKGGSGTRGRGDTIPEAIRPMLENTLKKPTYAGRLSFRKLPTSASLGRSEKQKSLLSRHKLTIAVVALVFFLVVSMFVAGILSLHYRRAEPEPTLAKRGLTPGIFNDIGEGTFFDVGLGACGEYSSNNEYVAALNHIQFGNYVNGSVSPACGMCLEVTGPLGTVRVRVVDKCPGCQKGDIDLSPTAFEVIAKKGDGRVKITWKVCA
jgi:hypothetical protein